MSFAQIQLISVILAEIIFIIVPFLAVFRREWRYSMSKTTGILMGYLFFVYFLGLTCFSPFLSRPWLELAWSCTPMTTNILVCKWMVRTDWPVNIYSLFLFKNFTDTAGYCADLSNASASLNKSSSLITGDKLLSNLIFLFLMVWVAYYILHKYLTKAVEYTRLLPVWKYLAAIPVLFFIMFRLASRSLAPARMLQHHPDMIFFAVCWFACIYTVHYVSLRILSRLSESYAAKEQYRTTRLLASVQKSQMATLQYNLEQFKKARHDYRHHLITLKGLLEQKETEFALEYINDYLGTYATLDTTQYCQNPSSNALLNYYIQTAQSQGIAVNSSICLPQSLPVPEIDFCTILGNLLSNAVEACQRQTQGTPSITINIGQAGESMIALSIQNTYSHLIRMKDGRFLSSKREDMGTGTTSVRYLVERYHGILKFDYSNGIFEASLLLNPAMK